MGSLNKEGAGCEDRRARARAGRDSEQWKETRKRPCLPEPGSRVGKAEPIPSSWFPLDGFRHGLSQVSQEGPGSPCHWKAKEATGRLTQEATRESSCESTCELLASRPYGTSRYMAGQGQQAEVLKLEGNAREGLCSG